MNCDRHKSQITGLVFVAILCSLFVVSCDGDDNGGDGGVPSELVSGTVRDVNGAPLQGVGIHVIYETGAVAMIDSVRLTDFSLIPGDRQITLCWSTTDEHDNVAFEIIRDGTKIAEVPTQGISSSYTYIDGNLQNGRMYIYTLISVEFDRRYVLASDSTMPSWEYGTVTEFALYQNFPNPVEDTTRITQDILEIVYTQLIIRSAGGDSITTLISAILPVGRHTATFYTADLANGFYEYQMRAGDFEASRTLLKNTSDYTLLRNTSSGATTAASGAYSFDVAIGDLIERRDDLNRNLGLMLLERVTLVALKNGYQPADTTLELVEGQNFMINFTLHPE